MIASAGTNPSMKATVRKLFDAINAKSTKATEGVYGAFQSELLGLAEGLADPKPDTSGH